VGRAGIENASLAVAHAVTGVDADFHIPSTGSVRTLYPHGVRKPLNDGAGHSGAGLVGWPGDEGQPTRYSIGHGCGDVKAKLRGPKANMPPPPPGCRRVSGR
jgi:hypothetical protein